MLGFAKKLFGSSNDRKVKAFQDHAQRINALEPKFAALSDDELRMMTDAFRDRLSNGESLDKILPEAFAVVREASKRVLGQRQYDVQLAGGMILHEGGIAEMRTGEGKTLVAVAPVYLNALEGKGVHVITVNDYLARRDAETMGRVYRFLGLEVGVIVNGLSQGQRQAAYAADVTYGTNNEFGFDYLRDNLVYDRREMVQRPHNFAIVDEVDSILIDEARTPLIISGPTEDRSDLYKVLDALIKDLIKDKDTYELDEKQKQVLLTELGSERLEEALEKGGHFAPDTTGLYDAANISLVHHSNQALRANTLYQRDKDYIIKGGEIILIDEFTGRMMTGRRLSEGLHQAIEAKEDVKIQPENQTLASVTIQNYFRLYQKLSGMTGTAATEAQEFGDIYKMEVLEVPTNRPIQRKDYDDEVYRTHAEKSQAIARQIAECHLAGQPILVGTVSIERSEQLSELLRTYEYKVEVSRKLKPQYEGKAKEAEKIGDAAYDITYETKLRGIPHSVLNARQHEQEAYIVADAGLPGAVTIATNMAGRGTDIQLGGNLEMKMQKWLLEQRNMAVEVTPEMHAAKEAEFKAEIAVNREKALAAGGLFVLGTERHESRRIDNQLRGRTGRQGDPGVSKFYLSCEDDLLRIFAGDRLDSIMKTFGVAEGEAITHPWLNRAIETAQKRVETRNYDIRKNLLKYDDVVNDQRKAVFEQRQEFMDSEDLSELVGDFRRDVVSDLVERYMPPKAYAEQWDIDGLDEKVRSTLGLELPLHDWAAEEGVSNEEIEERLLAAADARAAERLELIGAEQTRGLEKQFMLQMIDMQWREHLVHLDHLRGVIGLRGYGQRDPLQEYKTEAFNLFEGLLYDLRHNVTRWLMTVEFRFQAPPELPEFQEIHLNPGTGENEMADPAAQNPEGQLIGDDRSKLPVEALPPGWEMTGRNAPCPCGSGRKFKHCHGALI
ncbi:MAG: preprotein translocase subunit SecA [Pseudomonadota bacterium]|jgi:preprotein translocase subunit SecA|uniref:Protein translocase subunit SecA n=2 Tax=Brevundimonas TaxID=41275 RepID=A0A7W9C6S2_9CAUL|nr:preprotein translocase subunit SecA [Brevundimonas aurantiaca]MBB1178606.1 preprotein translocase subunit SecA [Pseudomonas sp. FW305-3-2-15-E-TSA4]MEC8455996.1 preprotein translocase subunit SecA [Pseudomonadota bacterium]MBB5740138.1 preprotein translocase subunit SecA [Brevundimonas aurantiaca]MCC4294103.1 preprotein translocase subunit SecA [Brevundimonas aurantiaca]MEC8532506.1 preprotein translocase subunit SecA [Pseudomonadota bacterium]